MIFKLGMIIAPQEWLWLPQMHRMDNDCFLAVDIVDFDLVASSLFSFNHSYSAVEPAKVHALLYCRLCSEKDLISRLKLLKVLLKAYLALLPA